MSEQARRAEDFHGLHGGPEILVLPNAWDAASAALRRRFNARPTLQLDNVPASRRRGHEALVEVRQAFSGLGRG